MFFLEPLLERLLSDFMSIWGTKLWFWHPLATQLGSQIDQKSPHFRKKAHKIQSLSYQNPPGTDLAHQSRPRCLPQRPQGTIFIDFEGDLAPQSRPRCLQTSILMFFWLSLDRFGCHLQWIFTIWDIIWDEFRDWFRCKFRSNDDAPTAERRQPTTKH